MLQNLWRTKHTSAPLRELLKDDVPWCWNAVHEEALQQLKKMITTAPVLAYYSPHVRTVVSPDASSFGIGAVLFQVQEDGRRAPVTYISRSLSANEQRFSQIEKKAMAMAWACEKLHCYVFGTEQPFLIETDNRPLESIMNRQSIDECPPRLMRLKLRMMRYCFRVEYVLGKKLAVADALSRAPVEETDNEIASLVEKHVQIFEDALQGSDKQIQRLRDETGKDPQLTALLECLRLGWPRTQKEL